MSVEGERPAAGHRVEDALWAARKYYLHGVTMDTIARELGASRSTVSRLLAYARDVGLVEIRVMPPRSRSTRSEADLAGRYGVHAHVVPVPATASTVERLERCAVYTARLLTSVFDSDMIIGLSWGTMVNAISRCLVPKQTANCQIVQLNGLGNARTTGMHYAGAVLTAFGAAFGAYVQQFPLPLFFDSARTKELLLAERSVRRVVELQQSADAVLFSVGTVTDGVPSSPYLSGYFLDEADFASLRQDGAVGDIATSFYRLDGSHEGVSFNARTSGPDLDQLRQVKHRICAVSGDHKVDALHAALAGGYVTDLVIDEITAHVLLERHP
ncbi:sugar-binding domain-containing protein [Nonomuraea sp. NPDC049607]|uniref:sugar-binding transcriptional regulator n=1 Tax=Nonomuraea sp. NPDC049607 TaxID=3154732 RepID=UPI003441AB20